MNNTDFATVNDMVVLVIPETDKVGAIVDRATGDGTKTRPELIERYAVESPDPSPFVRSVFIRGMIASAAAAMADLAENGPKFSKSSTEIVADVAQSYIGYAKYGYLPDSRSSRKDIWLRHLIEIEVAKGAVETNHGYQSMATDGPRMAVLLGPDKDHMFPVVGCYRNSVTFQCWLHEVDVREKAASLARVIDCHIIDSPRIGKTRKDTFRAFIEDLHAVAIDGYFESSPADYRSVETLAQ